MHHRKKAKKDFVQRPATKENTHYRIARAKADFGQTNQPRPKQQQDQVPPLLDLTASPRAEKFETPPFYFTAPFTPSVTNTLPGSTSTAQWPARSRGRGGPSEKESPSKISEVLWLDLKKTQLCSKRIFKKGKSLIAPTLPLRPSRPPGRPQQPGRRSASQQRPA